MRSLISLSTVTLFLVSLVGCEGTPPQTGVPTKDSVTVAKPVAEKDDPGAKGAKGKMKKGKSATGAEPNLPD